MAVDIHLSAVVEAGATLGEGVKIGPFCYVGANVTLHDRVCLKSHVAVNGFTQIGEDTVIWPFASVGSEPQDLKFHGEKTMLIIGKRNKIRESTSINPGTEGGGGKTIIGDDCLFMLGAHVGHDCVIGNHVILANNASISGHVTIGDGAIIGGLSGVHQFCRIGKGAIIGALAAVAQDVIPYASVLAERPNLAGLNWIGLKRAGADKEQIRELKEVYEKLFDGTEALRDRASTLVDEFQNSPQALEILTFISQDSDRAFMRPADN